MSKFLHIGLSLDEVVRRVTCDAARALHLDGVAGSLAVVRPGNVTLLQELAGNFPLEDCMANTRRARRVLVPRWVVLNGELLPARTAAPWGA
jgi:dihydroorotase